MVGGGSEQISKASAGFLESMGSNGVTNMVLVASNFERMISIANLTGMESEESLARLSRDISIELEVDRRLGWGN